MTVYSNPEGAAEFPAACSLPFASVMSHSSHPAQRLELEDELPSFAVPHSHCFSHAEEALLGVCLLWPS